MLPNDIDLNPILDFDFDNVVIPKQSVPNVQIKTIKTMVDKETKKTIKEKEKQMKRAEYQESMVATSINEDLTIDEREAIKHWLLGSDKKAIAQKLCLEPKTVDMMFNNPTFIDEIKSQKEEGTELAKNQLESLRGLAIKRLYEVLEDENTNGKVLMDAVGKVLKATGMESNKAETTINNNTQIIINPDYQPEDLQEIKEDFVEVVEDGYDEDELDIMEKE